MTLDQARSLLMRGGALGQLMEAIGTIKHHPRATISDLLLGMTHPECVAEQAAMTLYLHADRPLPERGRPISCDPVEWRAWLSRPLLDMRDLEGTLDKFLVPLADSSGRTAARSKPRRRLTKSRPPTSGRRKGSAPRKPAASAR